MTADGAINPRNDALDARTGVRLAVTPAAYPTESLLGYVLRVSEMNGYESPQYVWTSAGIHRGVERGAGFPVDRLARVLGRAPSELQRLAYREGEATAAAGRSDKRPFKILNHRLHRGGVKESAPFRFKHPAFCPQCVAKSGYIDALWDLEIAAACPVHRCRILRVCPACKVPLSWIRRGLLTCSCGKTLAGAHTQEATPALVELVGLVRAQLYGALQEELPNTSGLPFDDLRKMSLGSLLPMLMTLGGEVLRLPELVGDAGTALSVLTMADGAALALADWPDGFHRVLRAFGHQRLSAGVNSGRFRKQFESLYAALFKSGRDVGPFEFVRTEFLRFGQQWEHAVLDKRHLRSSSEADKRRFITIGDFAARHRIWKPTLARLIAEGAVVTRDIASASGMTRMVDLEKTVLPQELGESVTVRAAARELDLPARVLKTLRASGVYRVRPRRGRGSTYYRDDIGDFKQRLIALAAAVTEPDGEGSVALRDVMRLKLRSPEAKADILAGILDGRLPIVGTDGPGPGDLMINRSALGAFATAKRREAEADSLSLPECAAATALLPPVVPAAIRQGLLATVSRSGRVRVTGASAEAFNRNYVALRKFAARFKSSSPRLMRLCAANRIPVILLPNKDRVSLCQPIIHRDQEPALLERWQAAVEAEALRSRAGRIEIFSGRLKHYLAELIQSGAKLPRHGGMPDKSTIARACGFARHALTGYAELAALVAEHEALEKRA